MGNKFEEKGVTESISYDVNDFSDKEKELMAECVFEFRSDLDDLDDILIVQRDKEFKNFAIIVLFKAEMLIKCKGNGVEKYYDHNLGMSKERDRETDWEISILKNNLTSLGVTRSNICVCENCMANKDSTDSDQQPDIYEINFHTVGETHTIQFPDRDMAFQYKEWIKEWMMTKNGNKRK